jgi:hypothetical protein
MSRTGDTEVDRSTGVSIVITWNVTELKVLPGRRLEVGFADGLRGLVDMSNGCHV